MMNHILRAKAVLSILLILLPAIPRASASWQIVSSQEIASLGRGAGVREVNLSNLGQTVRLTAIIFNEKSHTLRIVDSPNPGHTKLSQVLSQAGCIAGVNGGYFHPDFRPIGLVVSNGKQIHGFEKARLLSGLLIVRGGRINIVRSGKFIPGRDLREALQCGPMLLENGLPVPGLNNERIARRTIVSTDGKGHWALVYLTSVTLADAARILATRNIFEDWTPRTALNLDGGSSSALWAATTPTPIHYPEFGFVRNYVGLIER